VVTVKSLVREHKPAVIRFYLDYRAVPKGNPMTTDKRDSGTHARYLYTTDLSLSEEEACRVGDRGPPRDVKALGLLVLEEGEASGLPHDLHRDQRRQGFDRELNLRSVEAFLMFSNVI